jgi:hypothetical protein
MNQGNPGNAHRDFVHPQVVHASINVPVMEDVFHWMGRVVHHSSQRDQEKTKANKRPLCQYLKVSMNFRSSVLVK